MHKQLTNVTHLFVVVSPYKADEWAGVTVEVDYYHPTTPPDSADSLSSQEGEGEKQMTV